MNFTLRTNFDKEFLLSKFPEEVYMEHYLGIPVKKGLVCNPLRRDNNPTASFYRNKQGELIFKDFGSTFYGNFINVVMEKYHCGYYEACDKIAEDFNLKSQTSNLKPIQIETKKFVYNGSSKIAIRYKDFSENELKWWAEYGISLPILKMYNVYSCEYVFVNGSVNSKSSNNFPIFGYYMGFKDKELWRIYFPKRSTYRFLSNTPASLIQGYTQLPDKGNLLVITKSMKDVMCLRSFGIYAIAPNSENLFVSDEVLEELRSRFNTIIVFYDNDLPGIMNMNKIKKQHKELLYFYIPRSYKAKDISDFTKMYGIKDTFNYINNYINNILK